MEPLTPQQIMLNLQVNMDDLSYVLIDYFTYKKHSVTAVKVIYNTIDGKGNPTTAPGVVFLPYVENITYMPVFSYLHGTLTMDLDVPSNLLGIESVIGWIMAMDGYIAVLPDYIGMGDGPGTHPYMHAESEASASVDLLKALILLCSESGILAKPDGNLYLSGYSQGAHAALATQRELQKKPLPGLSLRKTIAGSGAFSLSYIQKKFVFDNPEYSSPSFLPYLLLGYQDVYGNLYSSLNQVFVSPYNGTIPGLFDGSLTVGQIDNQLPDTWKSMFVPSYLWNIQYRYFHPVNRALRDNDVMNWKPETDLHLYYCTCDELVPGENSMLAYLLFLLQGSSCVTCLPAGPFDHGSCAPIALLLAKIQSDCDSGVNPCGFNKPLINSGSKAIDDTDMTMFTEALNWNNTLDPDEIYSNRQIAEYLQNESARGESIAIYPNPASDIVFIEIPDDMYSNLRIYVYDIQGRVMINENISGSTIKIDVKTLPQGLYKVVVTGLKTYLGTLLVTR